EVGAADSGGFQGVVVYPGDRGEVAVELDGERGEEDFALAERDFGERRAGWKHVAVKDGGRKATVFQGDIAAREVQDFVARLQGRERGVDADAMRAIRGMHVFVGRKRAGDQQDRAGSDAGFDSGPGLLGEAVGRGQQDEFWRAEGVDLVLANGIGFDAVVLIQHAHRGLLRGKRLFVTGGKLQRLRQYDGDFG